MADKGSKMAARQAALRNKKRKTAKASSIAPELAGPVAVPVAEGEESAAPPSVPAAPATSSAMRRRAASGVGRYMPGTESTATYPYLGTELKNIGFL
ncbi:MAG: hypothetical protein O2854_06935, partial [Chloroflexi bacterium]|nr:hypothetical protein [Chloroflexota bacterium]